MLRPLLACMLALVLLSGCMAARAPAPAASAPPAHATANASQAGAAAPLAGAPTSARANATAAAPATTRFQGTWAAGVEIPTKGPLELSGNVPFGIRLDGTETGLIVEMAWTPSTPASTAMGVDVGPDGKHVATAAGAGPLHLALPTPAAGNYVVNARPSGPGDVTGAFVLQDYTLWVTVFKGLPFDPAYVAPK